MKSFFTKKRNIIWCLLVLSLMVPLVIQNRYYQDIVIMTFIWAGLSSSWNLYSGYCKRLSIGHAAFLGIGAYSTSLLYINFGISPWVGTIVGMVLSTIVAFILGSATLRLKGTFFVLSTIAFAEILKTFIINAKDLTGGSLGLLIPYEPGLINMTWSGKFPYAVLAWAYMMLVIIACAKMEKSKLGYFLVAVGENQEAAENLGVNSSKTMVIAFLMSAAATSVGGSIMAMYLTYIDPSSLMSMTNSVQFILLAIAGGMGTVFGPIVGSFILVPLTNLLRGGLPGVSGLHGLVLGVVLVVVLLYKPEGIVSSLENFAKKFTRKGEQR